MPGMAHPVYKVRGKRVPSVTTVLGKFQDPGGLMYWANSLAVEPLKEAITLVESVLKGWGGSASTRQSLQSFIRSKPLQRADYRRVGNKAAEAGTIAHNLVDLWIHSDPQTQKNLATQTPEDIAVVTKCDLLEATQALSAFSAFIEWESTNEFQLLETEVSLVSEKYNYGGTLDCLGYISGSKFILLDWKTSKRLYAEYIVQLSAYGNLWNENWEPSVNEYHLVRFDKQTAAYHHTQFSDLSEAFSMFLKLRDCYRILADLEKELKRQE